MPMSPEEARDVRLAAKRGRYEQTEVDTHLASLLASLEAVWQERDEVRERLAALEEELAGGRDLERELRDSLVMAQRVAKELRDAAAEERDRIVESAHDEAAAVRKAMLAEHTRLEAEVERVRELDEQVKSGYKRFLVAALELCNEATADAEPIQARDGTEESARAGAGSASS